MTILTFSRAKNIPPVQLYNNYNLSKIHIILHNYFMKCLLKCHEDYSSSCRK